ncbi:MAG: HypC/HybG/HupF family hydrogenase formation chaperone [Nitrospira sp.]|nr:HypC/HybG/HupF family hydrogenase formation chaperone [bacterium]MBL7048012.1 HypC/HybG/HupF family hydrogenase formation chaperone [Nitrospira sp.]
MCVGVPMKIIEMTYPVGIAEAKGVKRNIGLQLLPEGDINIGDNVIVHVGFAIEKIDQQIADEIWEGLDEIGRLMDEEDRNARSHNSDSHG